MSETAEPTTVAFVGLGTMGLPMAQRLVDAGFELIVYDLSAPAVDKLVDYGARAARSAAEAAADALFVITMLPASRHVLAATTGPAGVLGAMGPDAILIDMSTIDPETTRAIAAEAALLGVTMLDAPVSGSSAGAADGTLTIMAGGDIAALKLADPILRVLGQRVFHCGDTGTGVSVKLANQIMAGVAMVAVAEAFSLAEALKIDPKLLHDVATTSSGNCWSLQTRPPVPGVVETSPVERDYEPGFMGALMRKDLDLAMTTGDALAVELPMTARARDLYDRAIDAGLGDLDFSAVFVALTRGSRVPAEAS